MKELRDLRRTFNNRLDKERRWLTDNASAEAWAATSAAQEQAKAATDIARQAKNDLGLLKSTVGGLRESVVSLTTARDTARASLREKSDMLEKMEAEVDLLQVTIAGYTHQERKLAKLRASLTEARLQSKAALDTQAAQVRRERRAEEERHDAELEQARAATRLAEAELAAELDQLNENISPPSRRRTGS